MEIPEEALLDDNDELNAVGNLMDWQQNGNIMINNIQLGMVRIEPTMPLHQPMMFSGQSSEPFDKATAQMPTAWADFFMVVLDSPTHFSWARKLLQSQFTFLHSTGWRNKFPLTYFGNL